MNDDHANHSHSEDSSGRGGGDALANHHEHADHDTDTNHSGHDPGHGGHAGHGDHVGQFRRLFWIMLVLAVPVVGFNDMFANLVGYQLPDAEWVWWVSPVLGTIMYFWGGWPFLTGGLSEVRSRKPGMMLLIGLAITVAFIASWGASPPLFDHELSCCCELALLVVIMLLGHWIELRALALTGSALGSGGALLPDGAEKGDGDGLVKVAPVDLVVVDVVIVRPGSSVAADGR